MKKALNELEAMVYGLDDISRRIHSRGNYVVSTNFIKKAKRNLQIQISEVAEYILEEEKREKEAEDK